MKKFQYSMENLLQVKLKLEDQAKIAYANARSRLTAEENKLEELEKKYTMFEEELRVLRSDKLDIMKIRHGEEALKVIRQNIKQQKIIVKNAAQRLEVARIRLNDAMVERKIQEKLKEKAMVEYMLEFEAEERKETDELISYNYSNPASVEEDR